MASGSQQFHDGNEAASLLRRVALTSDADLPEDSGAVHLEQLNHSVAGAAGPVGSGNSAPQAAARILPAAADEAEAAPQVPAGGISAASTAPAAAPPNVYTGGDASEGEALLPGRPGSGATGSNDAGAGHCAPGSQRSGGGGSPRDSDIDSVSPDSPGGWRPPGGSAASNPYWQLDGAVRPPAAGQPPQETPSSRGHQVQPQIYD